jgi:hypothetical protein
MINRQFFPYHVCEVFEITDGIILMTPKTIQSHEIQMSRLRIKPAVLSNFSIIKSLDVTLQT